MASWASSNGKSPRCRKVSTTFTLWHAGRPPQGHRRPRRFSRLNLRRRPNVPAELLELSNELNALVDKTEPDGPALALDAEPDTRQEDPFDELTMALSRAEALNLAVIDVEMSGEKRDVVGLADMIRREIKTARDICLDNLHTSKYWRPDWRRESDGGAS